MGFTAYNAKEWEKFARVKVATRALERLLASSGPDSCKVQLTPSASSALFIAKKGDKHQQRQVMSKNWQGAFLAKLKEHGALIDRLEDGVTYSLDKTMISGIKDGVGPLCIHTILWPDTPCNIDHSAPTENPAPVGVEEEVLEGRLSILQESKQAITDKLAVLDEEKKNIEAKTDFLEFEEEEGKEEKESETVEALKELFNLCTNISDLLIVHGKSHELVLKTLTKVAGEFEHIHSKVDKLHNENVHLRRENEQNAKSLTEIHALLETLKSQINPDDTVIGAVKKRLTELEKLATEHRDLLESGNKFVKTSMAESAKTMVDTAAKAFIQVDHSVVLTKMQGVEDMVVDANARTDKALMEVYSALEKVRAEYKNSTRVPAIIDRMTSIAKELQHLQGILPELPAQIKATDPDLSGI